MCMMRHKVLNWWGELCGGVHLPQQRIELDLNFAHFAVIFFYIKYEHTVANCRVKTVFGILVYFMHMHDGHYAFNVVIEHVFNFFLLSVAGQQVMESSRPPCYFSRTLMLNKTTYVVSTQHSGSVRYVPQCYSRLLVLYSCL